MNTFGWFPRYNPSGTRIAYERDGHWQAQWLNDATEIWQDGQFIRTATDTLGPHANQVAAGGNRWAGSNGRIVFTSWGLSIVDASDPAISPDGSLFAYISQPQTMQKTLHLQVAGQFSVLDTGAIVEMRLSNTCGVWMRDGRTQGHWFGQTFGDIQVAAVEGRPIPIDTPDGPWVLSLTTTGFLLRPFGAREGYRFDNGGQTYNPDGVYRDGMILVAFTDQHGVGQEISFPLDAPRVNLVEPPPVVVPPVNRALWLGWWEHAKPALWPPGNCLLRIGVDGELGTIKDASGKQFAQLVYEPANGLEAVADAERQVQQAPYPAVVYYDAPDWPRWPSVRPQDYPALQAYCPKHMSLAFFEASIRQRIALAPYRRLALVCQCYANDALTSDLAGLVPVYARLARDFPQVQMLLVFSDAGRNNTGLAGHPALRPIWAQLAATVQTPAAEPTRPDPPKPEPPKEPTMPLPTLGQWINHEFPQLVAAYKRAHPELGEPGAEWSAFQSARRGVVVPEGRWALVDMLHHELTGEPNRGTKPEPLPTLDGWINHEFPQLVAAYKQGHGDLGEPGAEWAAFQTARRGMVVPEGPWSFEKMLAHEQGSAGPAPSEPQPPSGPSTVNGRLTVDGRMLRDGSGAYYRPIWSSGLAILKKEHEPFLDWLVATGFNGCRVFAGALTWAGQSAGDALDRLPALLAAAAARGLYVEVTALTDTKDGAYNPRTHVREIADICGAHENAILELANEAWHPSQSGLTPQFLASMLSVVPGGVPVALGAAEDDESADYAIAGHYVTAHLDRGRDEWNMVRRVKELMNLSERTGKFVMNNEPIKFGSGNGNPSIAFTMGVLNRLVEVGGMFHFDEGLQGVVPAPGSLGETLALAFIDGSKLITTTQRLAFQNSPTPGTNNWPDSPIASADLPINDHPGTVIRLYCGLSGEQSAAVAVGLSGDPKIRTKPGWSIGATLAEKPGVRVMELQRG